MLKKIDIPICILYTSRLILHAFLPFFTRRRIMNPRFKLLFVSLIFIIAISFVVPLANAAKPIASISGFKGEVILLSGKEFKEVKVGLPLFHGDRIQTKNGRAEITFTDGAVMKVRPFASTMIQEMEEKSGWWVFKTKKAVRRITCFVGKLWFKSGASKRKNFMQTPTAVCGLRGSIIDFGTDLVTTYVNEIEGTAVKISGTLTRGAFGSLGNAFKKSEAFRKLGDAESLMKAAAAQGASKETKAQSEVAKLDAIVASISAILEGVEKGLVVLPPEAVDKLKAALDQAKKDLEGAKKDYDAVTTVSTVTTEPPAPTTEPPPPTTEPPPPTTAPTPTTSPIPTTVPATTTTVPVPTTTYYPHGPA
jgi:hypothetical protein